MRNETLIGPGDLIAGALFNAKEVTLKADMAVIGNVFYTDLDGPSRMRIAEVFADQDGEKLRELSETYGEAMVEAMAAGFDDATEKIAGVKTSYFDWATGVLEETRPSIQFQKTVTALGQKLSKLLFQRD